MPGVIQVIAVDDDSFMRDLLHKVLGGAGMQVVCYGSADELLSAGDLSAATILLLDVKMPGMSGLELQDLLACRDMDIPIVFLSGAADVAMAVKAMRNGASDFIEKPFDAVTLVERVCGAVARHANPALDVDGVPDAAVVARYERLSLREREVFELILTGASSKHIARDLGGSFRTIQIHRARVMHKMEARNVPELVRMSIESLPRPKDRPT